MGGCCLILPELSVLRTEMSRFKFLPEVGGWERLRKRRIERSEDELRVLKQFCLGFFLLLGEWEGQQTTVLPQIGSGFQQSLHGFLAKETNNQFSTGILNSKWSSESTVKS